MASTLTCNSSNLGEILNSARFTEGYTCIGIESEKTLENLLNELEKHNFGIYSDDKQDYFRSLLIKPLRFGFSDVNEIGKDGNFIFRLGTRRCKIYKYIINPLLVEFEV